MGRPRTFDEDKALEAAMRVFWNQGYEDASLADLLTDMGLTKGSFYKAFLDKKSLYLAALDLYARQSIAPMVEGLTDKTAGSGYERILRVFQSIVDMGRSNGDRVGCFLCNAAVDRAAHDPDVELRLNSLFARMEDGFAAALADHLNKGQGAEDVRAGAKALVSQFMGLRVLGRAGQSVRFGDGVLSEVRRLLRLE